MKSIRIYCSTFTEEEQYFIGEFLNTEIAIKENNVKSYIKIKIKSLVDFINKNRELLSDLKIDKDFIEYINTLSKNYETIRL